MLSFTYNEHKGDDMLRRGKNYWEMLLRTKIQDSDPAPGQTFLEWFGKSRVRIENHFGVTRYDENVICVQAKQGQYRVCGQSLHIAQISSVCLVITGKIQTVSFEGE